MTLELDSLVPAGTKAGPPPGGADLSLRAWGSPDLATEGPPDGEEALVADYRSGLSPSQMIDRKLAALLSGGRRQPALAGGGQDIRRMSGSREGAGPAQAADPEADLPGEAISSPPGSELS